MSTTSLVVQKETALNFRETVASGVGVRATQSFRLPGKIKQILFHFPPGCNALVQVALLKSYKPFYPIRGNIALDDASPVFYAEADYDSNEPLTLEVLNTDSVWSHTITCIVTLNYQEEESYSG